MVEEIVIRPPGPDSPGFLRRWKKSMALQQRIDDNDPAALDEMIDYMLETAEEVTVPEGVDPKDAILDLSRHEFHELLGAMRGENSTVDPQNGA